MTDQPHQENVFKLVMEIDKPLEMAICQMHVKPLSTTFLLPSISATVSIMGKEGA
jgi:hypothetical protein